MWSVQVQSDVYLYLDMALWPMSYPYYRKKNWIKVATLGGSSWRATAQAPCAAQCIDERPIGLMIAPPALTPPAHRQSTRHSQPGVCPRAWDGVVPHTPPTGFRRLRFPS